MVRISSHVCLSHWPKLGRVDIEYDSATRPLPPWLLPPNMPPREVEAVVPWVGSWAGVLCLLNRPIVRQWINRNPITAGIQSGLAYVPDVEAAALHRSDAVVSFFSSTEKNVQVNRNVVECLWRVLIYILSEPCRLPAKGREDRRDDALARPQSPDNESRLVWARSVVAVVEF